MFGWLKRQLPDPPRPARDEQEVQEIREYLSKTGLATYSAEEALGLFSAVSVIPRTVGWKELRGLVIDRSMFRSGRKALDAYYKLESLYLYAMPRLEGDPTACCLEQPDEFQAGDFCSGYMTGIQMSDDMLDLLEGCDEFNDIVALSDRADNPFIEKRSKDLGFSEEQWHQHAIKHLRDNVRAVDAYIRENY